jgi:hypothetical protein
LSVEFTLPAEAPKHENTKHSPQASKAKTQKHKTHALRVRLKHKNTKRQNTARGQKAVFLTAEKLNLHSVTQELDSWCRVLGHYSEALTRSYIMRPTKEDRSTFTEHARLYILKKALLRPGRLCWYDWQLWAAFPKLFEQVGSLRLLSQEAMEGQQRLNNEIARRSNGWANAGRIPDAIADLGAVCKKVYMSVRARLRPKPAKVRLRPWWPVDCVLMTC